MKTLIEYHNGITSSAGLTKEAWERSPFEDPVVEALYQAGWESDPSGHEPIDAIRDAEEIVAIVRAAIAQYAEALA